MSRPPRRQAPPAQPFDPVPSRPGTYRRYLRRLGRAQVAFAVLAGVVVCSLLASTLGAAVFTELGVGNDDADPTEFANPEGDLQAELRTQVAANPDDAAAMVQLADSLANSGNLDEAVDLYERAVALRPDDANFRYSFARSLQDGGKPADAEFQFKQALRIAPNDAQAHFYLAQLYLDWDPPRTAEAAAEYNQVVTLAPDGTLADLARGELAALGVAGFASPGVPGVPGTPGPVPVSPAAAEGTP